MQFDDFRRIMTCFADDADDIDVRRGELLVQLRGETVEAQLHQSADGLVVEERGKKMPATRWIVDRVARIPLLADRICSYCSPPSHFVKPSGQFLDQPDQAEDAADSSREDVVGTLTQTLSRRLAGTTSVTYVTSDAGEGKTSLIEFMALEQAKAYKAGQSDWLLVPIPLGGRTFLRFDDVVVSAMVNRLRFPFLYYEAFLELVRLGVIVPAFDGFEEMIVEASSGEAISALGNLVRRLRSAGSLLIAARKAYFDYPSFRSQARLFDSVGYGGDVAFGRVSLNRWSRQAFLQYAGNKGVRDPEGLFRGVADRLGDDQHPILTRAVLVTRLVDVATDESDLGGLLDRLGEDRRDYFHDFVGGLVEREARFKWLDKSGDPPTEILTIEEHHELLAVLAQEMWFSGRDDLRVDDLAVLMEMFSSQNEKTPAVARQIKERIVHHALLVKTGFGSAAVAFDHEDFRQFYLGQALGRELVNIHPYGIRTIIDRASVPALVVSEAIGVVSRQGTNSQDLMGLLQKLANDELPASFVRENCGALTLALAEQSDEPYVARNMSFPDGSLQKRCLSRLNISDSYFHPTSLEKTELHQCQFLNCTFERLEIDGSESLSECSLDSDCRVRSVVRSDLDDEIVQFDPTHVEHELRGAGFEMEHPKAAEPLPPEPGPDQDLRLAQRFLRAFLRANALNESTIRMRLGVNANHFFRYLLPELLQAGIVKEVQFQGRGGQRRMKLAVQMTRIEEAMSDAGGRFSSFVEAFRRRRHSTD